MIRALLSILFSLMLVATSHAMGAARHSTMAVDSMVICAGDTTYVVYVDGQGDPTMAPHMCPDCALYVSGALGPPLFLVERPLTRAANTRLSHAVAGNADTFANARARAPPIRG
ncbi:hypothetical protein [uncultured Tateyamaria sp.]|uniref:hypothetical protein n=1 Tax=uncultured Tateyamaria sp. TaxID=455651 RepID=UPI002621568B|nr:hypothetical protein [uncultured Tateyamaria sp.]